jgi:hypothetical protein
MRIEGPFEGETLVLFCDTPLTGARAGSALEMLGVASRIIVPADGVSCGGLERASRSGERPVVAVGDQPTAAELAELMRRGAAAVVVLAARRDEQAVFARTIEVLRSGFGAVYLPAIALKVA